MSKTTSTTKVYGLRLVLPGAAENTPYTLNGLPGLYSTDSVTPIGGPNEPTLEQAKQAASGPDAPVELVEIPKAKADRLREEQPAQTPPDDEPAGDGQEA